MLTPEQKKQRKDKVTSSVAAGCLGLCPFTSPLQAWRAILGLSVFEGNKATARGTELEPAVIDWGVKQTGLTYSAAPFVDGGWRGDSADGLGYEKHDDTLPSALFEAKTVAQGMASKWGKDGSTSVPHHVQAQCMWHLLHWPTAEVCWVPVLFGGYNFEFRLYHVDRDDAMIAKLEGLLHKWWTTHIEGNLAPHANHLDEPELRSMFPKDDSTMMADDPDVALHAIEYMRARDEVKAADTEKKLHANRLRQLLGDHRGCDGLGYSVLYPTRADGTRSLSVNEIG